MPLGRIHARPCCTVHAAHSHSTGSARVHNACGPRLAGPTLAYAACDGTARRASARRSGHRSLGAPRCGRRRHYNGRGGGNDGAQAPTMERLTAGHGGGDDSSPEFHVNGEGEKNWLGGGVF
jgi:hypothetical protein